MKLKVSYNPMGKKAIKPTFAGPTTSAITPKAPVAPQLAKPNIVKPKVSYAPEIAKNEPPPGKQNPKPPNPRPGPVAGPLQKYDPKTPPTPPGPMKPPMQTQKQTNRIRRNETPAQRLARLQAMRRGGNKSRNLTDRIKGLKNTTLDKDVKYKKQRPPTPVQLDDKPETSLNKKERNKNTSESLAELALPRGMDTMFYDNPEADAQNKTAVKQKEKVAKESTTTKETLAPTLNKDKNAARQDGDLADRLSDLQAKLAKLKPGDPKRAQLEARIANLKKRIAAGDTKGRNKNQPGTPQRPYRNREVSYRPLIYGGTLRI